MAQPTCYNVLFHKNNGSREILLSMCRSGTSALSHFGRQEPKVADATPLWVRAELHKYFPAKTLLLVGSRFAV
jgi:hypothetical protein